MGLLSSLRKRSKSNASTSGQAPTNGATTVAAQLRRRNTLQAREDAFEWTPTEKESPSESASDVDSQRTVTENPPAKAKPQGHVDGSGGGGSSSASAAVDASTLSTMDYTAANYDYAGPSSGGDGGASTF